MDKTLEAVLKGYIDCALWASTDDFGDGFDQDFECSDIEENTLVAFEEDCRDFLEGAGSSMSTQWVAFASTRSKP